MKNNHGVKPTRFKKKEGRSAIGCDPTFGPIFGSNDICIRDNCNSKGGWVDNESYECHSQHGRSLFVDTAKPDERNNFEVYDYEVFTY